MRIGLCGFVELRFFKRVPCATVGTLARPSRLGGAAVGANEDRAGFTHVDMIAD